MPQATTLLPCPFCGGAAAFDNSDIGPSEWVFCAECGATSSERNPNHKEYASAEEAWNTRHPAMPSNTTNDRQNIALAERAAIVEFIRWQYDTADAQDIADAIARGDYISYEVQLMTRPS